MAVTYYRLPCRAIQKRCEDDPGKWCGPPGDVRGATRFGREAHMTLEPRSSAVGRALQVFTRLCLAAMGVLFAAGVILRWDRIGSLHDPRWQVTLTVLGLTVGAWLAGIQARGSRRFAWIAAVSLITILLSQTCYLVLVWTSWKMHPWIWRCWWLSMIVAANSTHIIWLGMAAAPDRRWLMRGTIAAALLTSAFLAALGLRRHLLEDVSPLYLSATAITAALSTLGSLLLWLRGVRLSSAGRVPRAVKVGWIAVSQVVLVLIAFYAGRVTAPSPALFEPLPSALAQLRPDELEAQLRGDLARLRIILAGLGELKDKASSLHAHLREQRAAEKREYFSPAEDDQLRSQFMSHLAYRAALLRLVVTYSGFEAVRDPNARARCMLVGYAAGASVFDAGLNLVSLYRDDPAACRKLNEADPAAGIPAGMFDRIYENVSSGRNVQALAEMGAYYQTHRQDWLSAAVLPPEDFAWLEGVIDRSTARISAGALDDMGTRFEQILTRVRQDGYTPVYAVQSVVSTWIGDTRLVQWEPLIGKEQILEARKQFRPGDILLERRNWFLSNAFLPGFWPHSALYVGGIEDLRKLGLVRREAGKWTSDQPAVRERLNEYLAPAADGQPQTIIESVSEGVIFNSATESLHADYVAALRPRLTDAQKAQAIARAFGHLGKPYDFEFDFFSADKLVCTEVIYRAYEGLIHFDLVRVMGRDTLPALEIVRQFARDRGKPDRQLDFVLFLDRVPGEQRAAPAGEDTFCSTVDRPREFNE
jgi:hypothetical protein